MSDTRRAILLMAVFAVLWALIEAVAAHVLHRYSAWQVVWMRYATHLALMLAVWGWREPGSLWRTRRPAYQFARSMTMLAMPASWVFALQAGVQPATLMAVFWLSPLLILVFARVLGRERAHPLVWGAALVAYAGSLLLHPPGRYEPVHLLVFPFAMAASFSLYVVMTRELRSETTRANLFHTALGVFLVLTPVMPGAWIAPAPVDLLVMVTVGALGLVALYALDRMAHAAPVSDTAPIAYLQAAATVVIAVAAGGGLQSPRRAAVGLALVCGVALFLWTRDARPRISGAPSAGALRPASKEQ